ncbi:MAG: hypothetical protein JWQ55_250 [Rhodopila sp.]|nr:hypothetical protein [Rhodopila sp.]
MKPLRTLSTALSTSSFAMLLFAGPAYSQTDPAASLLEALSLVSGRMLVSPTLAPRVTRDGDRFHVHIPLPKLSTPPDASIEVTATPLPSGVWDITGLTFPQAGTLLAPNTPDTPPVSLRFTIGQQEAHARVDPTLSVPSPYAMAFSDLALHIESAAPPADLIIGQMTLDGTITGASDGRITTRSRSRADNWRLTTTTKTGTPVAMSLKSADIRYDVNGLDRTQAERLEEATRAVAADQRATPPGQPSSISPAVREQLRAIIEASAGLMSGFDIEETVQGMHFQSAAVNNGDIGEIRLNMAGEAADNRVAGHLDIGLNDITVAALPPYYAPHRIAFRTAFSGIPVEPLRHLLLQATTADPDSAALRTQAVALLNAPGVRAGIETIQIEAGPLRLQGSARVRPLPDGSAGFDVHLTAHGLDAMLALVQADPKAQQVMPMLFMAKGMAKPDGDGLVWDIGFANGVVMVNGVPMGQKPGGVPGTRPPVKR